MADNSEGWEVEIKVPESGASFFLNRSIGKGKENKRAGNSIFIGNPFLLKWDYSTHDGSASMIPKSLKISPSILLCTRGQVPQHINSEGHICTTAHPMHFLANQEVTYLPGKKDICKNLENVGITYSTWEKCNWRKKWILRESSGWLRREWGITSVLIIWYWEKKWNGKGKAGNRMFWLEAWFWYFFLPNSKSVHILWALGKEI